MAINFKKGDLDGNIKKAIADFMKSDAPQFKGKSEEEIRRMAIAAAIEFDNKKESLDEARLTAKKGNTANTYRVYFSGRSSTPIAMVMKMGSKWVGKYQTKDGKRSHIEGSSMKDVLDKLEKEFVHSEPEVFQESSEDENYADQIRRHLEKGGRVVVTTYTKSTVYNKKHTDWFITSKKGELLVKHGRGYNTLSLPNNGRLLVDIKLHK